MPILFKELTTALLRAILDAGSQDAVKKLISQSLQQSNTRKMCCEELTLFIRQMITQLEALNPMNKNEKEWSNINMARIYLRASLKTCLALPFGELKVRSTKKIGF